MFLIYLMKNSSFASLKGKMEEESQNIINGILIERTYNSKEAIHLNEELSKKCIDNLKKISEKFKYILNSIIIQKNGIGLHQTVAIQFHSFELLSSLVCI